MISPKHSRLFWKAFLPLLLGVIAWSWLFYGLTVPYLNRLAYQVEEAAGRNVMKGVVEVVQGSSRDLEAWRQHSLERHRTELRTVIDLVQAYLNQLEAQQQAGKLTPAQARQQLFQWLRSLRFGEDGYVWAANEQAVLVAHPYPEFDGLDASKLRDLHGDPLVTTMIVQAQEFGEGFHTYWWRRIKGSREEEKLSYFRHFPKWGLIIGTGLYVEDVDAEVARRKAELLEDLRHYLRDVRLAGTGYLFLIDGEQRILLHHDPALEGQSVQQMRDGQSGEALGPKFLAAAQANQLPVLYHWNRPDDPDNYAYRKLAWIFHLPEYDWYLGASVYEDDLAHSGSFLRDRMLAAVLCGLLVAVLLAYWFIRQLTTPIRQLAAIAQRGAGGDLSVVAEFRRNDEIGDLATAFNGMVVALRERIAALAAAEIRVRNLLEQSLAGIFVARDGTFLYVNPALVDMLGFTSAAELLACGNIGDLLLDDEREQMMRKIGRLQLGELRGGECSLAVRHRRGLTLEVRGSFRRIDFEGQPAVVGVLLDISELRRAELAREHALQAAEELSSLKSQLIANMSHELRTPLNGILGMAYLGERSEDVGKLQRYCQRIRVAGEGLLELVVSLLDFSDLERGKLRLVEARFDLRTMFGEIERLWRQRAQGKGLDFVAEIADDLPAMYLGDRERLMGVIGAVLSNAVKFTEKGEVRLKVGVAVGRMLIEIADTGIGMDEATVDRLFRPFEQLDGQSTRLYGGVGLGLALAQALLGLMGGQVAVLSEPGLGTVFTLSLPGRFSDREPPTAEAADYSI